MSENIYQDGIIAFHHKEDSIEPASWKETDYYKEKTIIDRIPIEIGNRRIELIQFKNTIITSSHKDAIRAFIHDNRFSRILSQSRIQYILVNDEVPALAPSEDDSGLGMHFADYIMLTPKAFMPLPHRVTDKVDRLTGTLIHETMEGVLELDVNGQFLLEWSNEFGFVYNEQTNSFLPTTKPDLCITAYAAKSPYEDICDSTVAYFYDSKRLYFPKFQKLPRIIYRIHLILPKK